jgi:trans-4-hydroxy-L-proline dehydratase
MNEYGRTERVEALRLQSESSVPHLSMERAVLMTEAYEKYGGRVSNPMLRALSFEHLMTHQQICINDHELIVGERGPGPQSASTYPELCCHTLEDMQVMNDREKSFSGYLKKTSESRRRKSSPFGRENPCATFSSTK